MPKIYVQTHGEQAFGVEVDQWGDNQATHLQNSLADGSGWVRIGNEIFLASSIKCVTISKPIE